MLGILSSGYLAIPVLAGSAAYVVTEALGWSGSLNDKFKKAKGFYTIIIASTAVGLLIPILGFNPVKTMFYTALLYGIIAPVVILMILHMANNSKIMGQHTNSKSVNFLGYTTFFIMAVFAGLIFFIF